MKDSLHHQILQQIKKNSGKGTAHTFLDSYLGNSHFRYPISAPVLRRIAKDWMKDHRRFIRWRFRLSANGLGRIASGTEKSMAGILLDYATADQRKFKPALFDQWLNHLEGWAEIDAVCTGRYAETEVVSQWDKWKPLLIKFSKSKNINKRRASIVFFCSPLSKVENEEISQTALQIVDTLKAEREILITKAISWILRSMVRYNRENGGNLFKRKCSVVTEDSIARNACKIGDREKDEEAES